MQLSTPTRLVDDDTRVRLLRNTEVLDGGSFVTFRYSVLGSLLVAAVFLSSGTFGGYHFLRVGLDAPPLAWVVIAPGLAIAALLAWLIGSSLVGAVQASALPTNWAMKVGQGGVWVQLRSYLNHAFEDPERTAVFVPFSEIEGARRVREVRPGADGSELRVTQLELVLRIDTQPIAEALDAEARRHGPERSLLGVRSRSRSNHAPAFLAGPGRLRIDWRGRRMLDVLAENGVKILPVSTTNAPVHDTQMLEVDPRVRELLARGEKVAAIRLLREEKELSLTEAKRLVDGWSEPAA